MKKYFTRLSIWYKLLKVKLMEDFQKTKHLKWKPIGKRVLITLGVALLLFNAVYFIQSQVRAQQARQYPLLSRRVLSNMGPDIIINFSDLNNQLTEYLDTKQVPYSVFFEYLPSGTSFKAGEHNELVGASLMKLPIVMNLYKAYEAGKVKPTDTITLKKEWLNSDYGDLWKRGAGATITFDEAAYEALVNSDNTAILSIVNSTNNSVPSGQQALQAIDASVHYDKDSNALITADMYASILKCLYFSCFLEKGHSQEILNMLTKSTGSYLENGIPNDVKVAHKIGQWGQKTTSDCGIVYVPSRPYILCVMVADDSADATKAIEDVSKLTYDYVTKAE